MCKYCVQKESVLKFDSVDKILHTKEKDMKKLSVFLAAIMMFVMVAASMGPSENVQAMTFDEIDHSESLWYDSSKAGTKIYFWCSLDYATAAETDVSGMKVALCPVDNVTLDAAVLVYDVKNEHKTINDERQWARISFSVALPNDIPEGEYVEAFFSADGQLYYADSYMTESGLKYNGTMRVNKTIVEASAWLMNNDGYAYAYVYSESPLVNASTYPTFYAADMTTAVTSFVDYTVGKGEYGDTVHYYKLKILDPSAFTFDEGNSTYVYYTMGTPTLPSGNDGGIGLYRCNSNSIAWTTACDLNARAAEYPEMFSVDDPFNPSSSDSAPSEPAPVEQEIELPSGEEVRMITTGPNSSTYVIGDPGIVPEGANFDSTEIIAGDGYTMVASAVERHIGKGLEHAVFQMDLTSADGVEINQLSGYINVTLLIPSSITLEEGKTIVVYRYEDNGTLTKCATVVDENFVTFATNHFSFYVLVEQDASSVDFTGVPSAGASTGTTSTATTTTSPKTADVSMVPAMMAAIVGMGVAVVAKKRTEI